MALRRVFRAFVCAYRGMDGKFHRAKKPIVVFWAKSSGVLVGRDGVHGVVLGRDGTRSVRRVRRARQRRGKSDVRIVCVGQVFVRIVPCAVFRGKKSPAWTCHNDCHFGVNVDFLYFYSAIPRGETCKSRRSRPVFMVFVSVVAVLRRRDYKLKKRTAPPAVPKKWCFYVLFAPAATAASAAATQNHKPRPEAVRSAAASATVVATAAASATAAKKDKNP